MTMSENRRILVCFIQFLMILNLVLKMLGKEHHLINNVKDYPKLVESVPFY